MFLGNLNQSPGSKWIRVAANCESRFDCQVSMWTQTAIWPVHFLLQTSLSSITRGCDVAYTFVEEAVDSLWESFEDLMPCVVWERGQPYLMKLLPRTDVLMRMACIVDHVASVFESSIASRLQIICPFCTEEILLLCFVHSCWVDLLLDGLNIKFFSESPQDTILSITCRNMSCPMIFANDFTGAKATYSKIIPFHPKTSPPFPLLVFWTYDTSVTK